MSKIRIGIEAIENEEISEGMKEPIECDGFVIIAIKEGDIEVRKHSVTRYDIAKAISRDAVMFASSIIAKALIEAQEIEEKSTRKQIMARILDL